MSRFNDKLSVKIARKLSIQSVKQGLLFKVYLKSVGHFFELLLQREQGIYFKNLLFDFTFLESEISMNGKSFNLNGKANL